MLQAIVNNTKTLKKNMMMMILTASEYILQIYESQKSWKFFKEDWEPLMCSLNLRGSLSDGTVVALIRLSAVGLLYNHLLCSKRPFPKKESDLCSEVTWVFAFVSQQLISCTHWVNTSGSLQGFVLTLLLPWTEYSAYHQHIIWWRSRPWWWLRNRGRFQGCLLCCA